jgi:hypothetical protein
MVAANIEHFAGTAEAFALTSGDQRRTSPA